METQVSIFLYMAKPAMSAGGMFFDGSIFFSLFFSRRASNDHFCQITCIISSYQRRVLVSLVAISHVPLVAMFLMGHIGFSCFLFSSRFT